MILAQIIAIAFVSLLPLSGAGPHLSAPRSGRQKATV